LLYKRIHRFIGGFEILEEILRGVTIVQYTVGRVNIETVAKVHLNVYKA
jgi:hypothetical protein